ncbi:MAG: polysaccharide deacetylase family protein [Chitinophagaceae bacterium]
MQHGGILNVSLDFELHWGRFDKVPLDATGKKYFENTRTMFPRMVELFIQYDVHVTWAIVGMLYNRTATEWNNHKPSVLPTYAQSNYSSYEWVKANGLTEPEDPYHFAPDLISLIEQVPQFEMATHTYSHYYCKEEGQTIAQFRADLMKAKEMAISRNHTFKSLVFPRNQFNEAYLTVCKELGIETVRINPDVWYWDANRKESLRKKIFRTGDAYTSLLGNKTVALKGIALDNRPLQLPTSRLYRAWTDKSKLLNQLKMQRILGELKDAAMNARYYHLWWHPHNFGFHPEECLNELEIILKAYQQYHQQYGFNSYTMYETKEVLCSLQL